MNEHKSLLSRMVSPEHNRSANIYETDKGFEVVLYEADKEIRVIEAWDHSESWAENVAENWNQGVIRS